MSQYNPVGYFTNLVESSHDLVESPLNRVISISNQPFYRLSIYQTPALRHFYRFVGDLHRRLSNFLCFANSIYDFANSLWRASLSEMTCVKVRGSLTAARAAAAQSLEPTVIATEALNES